MILSDKPPSQNVPFHLALTLLGIVLIVFLGFHVRYDSQFLLQIAIFGTLAVAAEQWQIKLPRQGVVTVADAVYYACIIIFASPGEGSSLLSGAAKTAFVILLGTTLRRVLIGQKWYIVASNSSQAVVPFSIGALFYGYFAAGPLFFPPLESFSWSLPVLIPYSAHIARNLAVLIVTAGFCFFLNSAVVSLGKAIQQGLSFGEVWYINNNTIKINMLMLSPLGLLMAVLYQIEPLSLLLLIPPLVVMYRSIKSYTDLLEEAKATIEALAAAVDKRNEYTFQHSEKVASLAADIGRELKLKEFEVEKIKSACRIHDLGKVSVPDRILKKPGPLTEEEFRTVKQHPSVGAEVSGHLTLCQDEAELIRYHHERYDGTGYPEGRAGESIPLGSRIISVADAFDAMTKERPYRKPLGLEEAIRRIEGGKGTQFDPKVVEAFMAVMKRQGTWKKPESDTADRAS